jgi:outer membrane protein TolC
MLQLGKYAHILREGYWRSFFALTAWLVFSGGGAAQDLSPATSRPDLSLPAATAMPLGALVAGVKANNAPPPASGSGGPAYNGGPFSTPNRGDATTRVHRITLEEAQQMAGGASNPLVHLGQLQVEAAKQHRLGVESLYFPNLGSQFDNLHFNKQPGTVAAFTGPVGRQREVDVNIFKKDQTVVNLSGVQPVTPIIAIRQLVKIARADENIARAKAGMPVAEIASNVEKNYYDLLVAQRELKSAEADARKIQGKWVTASMGVTSVSTEQEKDMISAEQAVVTPTSKVKELTASLNELLGLPEGTRLELVPPEPLVENISLTEVTDKAMLANPEVVEAEQTAIKAHAANTISKLAYGPNVAIVGGYANQTAISSFVFQRSEAYIGLIATYTIFDFGKREHDVKESAANAEAADLGVSLTKAKVAAAVKNAYFELERSRQFTQLARRMASATRLVEASYQPDNPEVESARAKVEADMFRAELEYRQAYTRLKSLMGKE